VGRLLNNFFGSVFTRENCSNIPEPKKRVFDGAMNALTDIDITPEMGKVKVIKGLKQNNAVGWGGVVILIFKGG